MPISEVTISTELISAIGTAITGIISAIGVILIAIMGRKVAQVERQGNSVSLELKRVNMVYAKRLASAERTQANIQMAQDATDVYEAAKRSAESK